MPSMVNELLHTELEQEFEQAGSCLVLSFDKLDFSTHENSLTACSSFTFLELFSTADTSLRVVLRRVAAASAKKCRSM